MRNASHIVSNKHSEECVRECIMMYGKIVGFVITILNVISGVVSNWLIV